MPEELSPPVPIPVIASNGVPLLLISKWKKLSWLWHGFSTRRGGVSRAYCAESTAGELNLGFTAADDRESVLRNRMLLTQAVTGDLETPLCTVRQCHTKLVVAASGPREVPATADGIITAKAGFLIAVQTADCVPVLVADTRQRVVGAFHAGWRGTVNRIVESGIGKMRLDFNSKPQDLVAAIGPCVGACCYAIGDEVMSAFESQFTYSGDLFHEVFETDSVRTKYPMLFLTQRAPGHSPMGPNLHLDLVEANRRQLLDAGLRPSAIQLAGGCTSCMPDLFFSHRASKGHAGRMMSVIGIRPS
ncbi:MAG TPA: peptidoglycan editing factor PgeF [Terracidiphilus sp.]|jgi:hypothetical protein|nr:peptidoglycan editing factor PgeF [Terracidiphilus sp.]